jgi:hypothetical protein
LEQRFLRCSKFLTRNFRGNDAVLQKVIAMLKSENEYSAPEALDEAQLELVTGGRGEAPWCRTHTSGWHPPYNHSVIRIEM